jgi:hypothetical protein
MLDIYREVVSRVGNRPDAEDLTEETFFRFLADVQTPVCASTALVGLRRVSRVVVGEHWRRAYGAVALEGLHVTNLLSSLPPRAERLLRLRFGRSLTIAEAAAVMNVSEHAARLLQYEALVELTTAPGPRLPRPRSLRRISSFVEHCLAGKRPERWQLSADENAAVQAAAGLAAWSAALQVPRQSFVERLGNLLA